MARNGLFWEARPRRGLQALFTRISGRIWDDILRVCHRAGRTNPSSRRKKSLCALSFCFCHGNLSNHIKPVFFDSVANLFRLTSPESTWEHAYSENCVPGGRFGSRCRQDPGLPSTARVMVARLLVRDVEQFMKPGVYSASARRSLLPAMSQKLGDPPSLALCIFTSKRTCRLGTWNVFFL